MKMLSQALKSWQKNQGWIFLNTPCAIMLLFLVIDPSYWKPLTSWSGYFAVSVFCGLLMLNPLRVFFATSGVLRELNKHRRILGVACFNYALLHVICFAVKRGSFMAIFKWVLHPVILPGFIAFLILIPLAMTSNKASLKYLKFPKWKKLHTKVYIAEWGIFIHMISRGGDIAFWGYCLFIPLFIAQLLRRYKRKKEEQQA